ncbi:hypothetical protein [Proteocatella sphenisci]|uniref:hypothetical protein n=1 Tax=Proteocatella sphenisci TaxID=181070 RepID=UPI00048BAAA2|nr:hypothetical protein [Proteocatella sphenisci]
MKYNKKIVAGILSASLCAGSFAFAAPAMTRNIGVNYNLKLKVNGQDYTVTDENQRPFKTSDGRSYVSVASLNSMGIATSTYADNTVTIKNVASGPSSTEVQSQLNAVIAQNNGLMTTNNNLMTENAKLKAELETLKGSSSSSDNTGDAFEDLRSSDKRELVSDIESDLRSIRADSIFQRSQRFIVSASIDDDSVSLELTPDVDWTAAEIKDWNDILDDNNDYDDLEEDFEDFVQDVLDELKDTLDDYKGYDVKIEIHSDKDAKNLVVDAEYRSSKDKIYVDFNDAK